MVRAFDARGINPRSRQAVEAILQTRGNSFTPAVVKRASEAAVPLAAWVTTNVKYSYVLEKIKPLGLEQNILQTNLSTAEAQLEGLTQRWLSSPSWLCADMEFVATTATWLRKFSPDWPKSLARGH